MGMRNDFYQIAFFFQVSHNSFSRLIPLHTGVFSAIFIDGGIVVHDVDLRQVVTFAHLKVVGVVSRRDLYSAGSKFLVYVIVCHNGDLPVYQRQDRCFSYNIFVSFILRMYGNGGIAKHGLRTGGRDLQIVVGSHDGVFDVPEMSFLFLMLHFRIRKGSLTYRTPVDDPGTFVNVAFFVKADEYFLHRFGAALVQSKPLSVPVTGNTQLL